MNPKLRHWLIVGACSLIGGILLNWMLGPKEEDVRETAMLIANNLMRAQPCGDMRISPTLTTLCLMKIQEEALTQARESWQRKRQW